MVASNFVSVDVAPVSPTDAMGSLSGESTTAGRFIEHRRERRYTTSDAAEVEVFCGGTRTLAGTVVDISRSGLRLELKDAIPRGVGVKIRLRHELIIFGEARYCRAVKSGFQVGVAIQDVFFSHKPPDDHVRDDDLGLYVVGKGLTVPEVIRFKNHVSHCEHCERRLAETNALLNPVRKGKNGGDPPPGT